MSTKVSRVGDHLRRLGDGGHLVEPRVGHRHVADIRLDGAERDSWRPGPRRSRQRVEEGGLADIRQPDDAAFETHARKPSRAEPAAQACRRAIHCARTLRPVYRPKSACGVTRAWRAASALRSLPRPRLAGDAPRSDWNLSIVAVGEVGRLCGDGAEQRLEPCIVGLGEIMQHMAGHQVLVSGMADADAHAHISRCRYER